jgi:hypothetical protein
MNKGSLARRFQFSDSYSYVLSFCLGQAFYFLKLISIVKILDSLSLEAFPFLMLAQGFVSYGFMKFCGYLKNKSNQLFYAFSLLTPIVVIGFTYLPFNYQYTQWGWIVSSTIFLASMNFVGAVELSIQSAISQNTSILKNPKISLTLTLLQEIGIIAAAITFYLYSSQFSNIDKLIIASAPFVFSYILLVFFKGEDKVSEEELKTPTELNTVNKYNFPFINLIVVLMTLMLVVKNIQSFAVLVGIDMIKANGSDTVTSLFSQISLIEAGLIIAMLFFDSYVKKGSPSWSRGFKTFFGFEVVSLSSLVLSMNPFLLLSTGIGRKVIQHSFVSSSERLLFSSIPKRFVFKARHYVKTKVSLIFPIVLSSLTAMAIYGIIPFQALWGIGVALSIAGLYYRKALFRRLNEYLVGNIVRTNIYDSANACYALAHEEASNHASAMISLLENKPRPFIAKAIIHSLGEMRAKKAFPVLTKYYSQVKREDIQLAVINSLLKFDNHNVNLFLVDTLQEIIKIQVSLGQIRRSIFRAISVRTKDIAIPYLLTILNNNDQDHRIIANALIVLGELAEERNDSELFSVIARYLDPKYPRRVRSNAILFLYHNKKYRAQAVETLEVFLTSNDAFDRSAVAYLAGELKIRGMLPFIVENSIGQEHKNSTLLISLLKQDYPGSARLIADFIMNATDDDDLYTCINQMSAISQKRDSL